MKLIYNINKVVIIINVILVIIPFFALLFMTITGVVQVISYLAILTMWKRTDPSIRNYLSIYPFLVAIALGVFSLQTDVSFVISLSLSALIGIGFLFLLRKQKNILSKITTDEL